MTTQAKAKPKKRTHPWRASNEGLFSRPRADGYRNTAPPQRFRVIPR